jgi:hypothetical protein
VVDSLPSCLVQLASSGDGWEITVEEGPDTGGGDPGDFVLAERGGAVVGPVTDLGRGQQHEVAGRKVLVVKVQ